MNATDPTAAARPTSSGRVLAAVGPGPDAAEVVRAAERHAARAGKPWSAVFVATPATERLGPEAYTRTLAALALAERLGARTAVLSGPYPSAELLGYAASHGVDEIVVGRPSSPGWRRWLFGSATDALLNTAGAIDVLCVATVAGGAVRRRDPTPRYPLLLDPARGRAALQRIGLAVAVVAVCTGIAALLAPYLASVNLAMLYLLGVLVAAVRLGRTAAVTASCLSVLAFDVLFVPPRWSLAVHDAEYLFTFAVMLVVGLTISSLASGLRWQAAAAGRRERRTGELYALLRELAAAGSPAEVTSVAAAHARAVFGPEVVLDAQGAPSVPGAAAALAPDHRRHLELFAAQVRSAHERLRLGAEAERARLEAETERVRSSMLAALSHDLRTPLAGILGTASHLAREARVDDAARREAAAQIADDARRMADLAGKLLDMARFSSGGLVLAREWIPLEEVVGSALAGLRALSVGRALRVAIAPEVGSVWVDPLMLERVIANLVENALKFAPASAEVRVLARRVDAAVEVTVEDDGLGLPPGREHALFAAFERGAATAAQPGVGLGLAICRLVAEAHGGTIAAGRAASGGASFRLTLPQDAPPPASEPETLP